MFTSYRSQIAAVLIAVALSCGIAAAAGPVVQIQATDHRGTTTGLGVYVGQKIVLTNSGTLAWNPQTVVVTDEDGRNYPARVLDSDDHLGQGAIELFYAPQMQAAEIATAVPQIGDPVVVAYRSGDSFDKRLSSVVAYAGPQPSSQPQQQPWLAIAGIDRDAADGNPVFNTAGQYAGTVFARNPASGRLCMVHCGRSRFFLSGCGFWYRGPRRSGGASAGLQSGVISKPMIESPGSQPLPPPTTPPAGFDESQLQPAAPGGGEQVADAEPGGCQCNLNVDILIAELLKNDEFMAAVKGDTAQITAEQINQITTQLADLLKNDEAFLAATKGEPGATGPQGEPGSDATSQPFELVFEGPNGEIVPELTQTVQPGGQARIPPVFMQIEHPTGEVFHQKKPLGGGPITIRLVPEDEMLSPVGAAPPSTEGSGA